MIFTTNKPLNDWGQGPTRRRYGGSHPRSGSRARTLYPPRWTLRENPPSQPGRDLARKYKRLRISGIGGSEFPGTHTQGRKTELHYAERALFLSLRNTQWHTNKWIVDGEHWMMLTGCTTRALGCLVIFAGLYRATAPVNVPAGWNPTGAQISIYNSISQGPYHLCRGTYLLRYFALLYSSCH